MALAAVSVLICYADRSNISTAISEWQDVWPSVRFVCAPGAACWALGDGSGDWLRLLCGSRRQQGTTRSGGICTQTSTALPMLPDVHTHP